MTSAVTEITFVTGPRGSGKTTIARALYDELCPRRSTTWFDGDEYGSTRHMGAFPLSEAENVLIGYSPKCVIVSSSDGADLDRIVALTSRSDREVTIRVVRCSAMRASEKSALSIADRIL